METIVTSVQVPGRLFPIQLKYRPIKEIITDGNKKSHKIDPEPFLRVIEVYGSLIVSLTCH